MKYYCKKCGTKITGRGKTGLCHSCVSKIVLGDIIHRQMNSERGLKYFASHPEEAEKRGIALNSLKSIQKRKTSYRNHIREDLEFARHISDNLQTPEIHRKQGDTLRFRIQTDNEFAKNFFRRMSRKSKTDRIFESFILLCSFPFRYTGNGEFVIKGICADFAHNNNIKVIEISDNQNTNTLEKFISYKIRRTKEWKDRGIESLIIHGSELEDLSSLANKISKFCDVKLEVLVNEV